MIHIGYGDSATGCLNEAINEHGLEGSRVVVSREDFTQGPISDCGPDSDFDQRISYWKMIDGDVPSGIEEAYEMDIAQFYRSSIALFDDIRDSEVMVWQGDSVHDILATAWLLTYLQNRNLKWYIVDLGGISPEDLNEGRVAVNLAMFTPSQIKDLYKYKQELPQASIQIYQDLWRAMAQQNSAYRIKKGQEILSVDEDYHDEFIMTQLSKDWMVSAKAVGQIMGLSQSTLSDTTVEWRIKQLIKNGSIDYRGNLGSINEYEVRIKP